MSETDEDGAFQSADEGEEEKRTSSSSQAPSKDSHSAKKVIHPDPILTDPKHFSNSIDMEGPPEGNGHAENAVNCPNPEVIERDGASGGNAAPAPEKESKSLFDRLSGATEKAKPAGGWGSWGTWGASIISNATTSVTHFTTQVGDGFQTVLDSVESSLGAPNPEEIAKGEQTLADNAKEPNVTPDGQPVQTVEGEREGDRESETTEEGGVTPDTPSEKSVGSNKSAEKPPSERSARSGGSQKGDREKSGGAEGGNSAGWLSWGGISGITSMVKDTGLHIVKGGEKFVVEGFDMIENTGKTLVSGGEKVLGGGINVLESIGKKTYDAIGDHGLKETLRNKPNLSQLLRDAKNAAENRGKKEAEYEEARRANFGAMFDDYNGLVHLEALETVSNTCESRVQNLLMVLSGDKLDAAKHELIIMKEIFQIDELTDDENEEPPNPEEDHDLEGQVTEQFGNLGLNMSPSKLIQVHHKSRLWLKDCSDEQEQGVRMQAKACKSLAMYDGIRNRNMSQEIHQMAIQSLAELTAVSVEHFHKVAQMLQMKPEGSYSVFKSKATVLFNLVRVLAKEVDIMSVQFTHRLNKAAEDAENPDSVNPFITNVYLEATNSKTYIQDAFQLLLPILQHSALQANAES